MTDDSIKIHKSNEPNITMTDSALTQAKRWLDRTKSAGIRLSTKETGCSGLEYILDIVHDVNETDLVSVVSPDVTVFVPKESLPFVRGTKLDYVKEGVNSKFTFNNPNATGVCGCGESFTTR